MKILSIRNLAPLAACALLLPSVANAQTTSFTATGQFVSRPSPGIVCTNALGQVFVRGIIQVEREQGSDPRVTGQVLSVSDGAFNADGSANLQGTAHLQVGTWDASSNFVPSGGVWEANWRGVLQPDSSGVYSIVAYGVGGSIDGWRLEQTDTVTNASAGLSFYTGTIKPPPLSTTNHLALNSYAATYCGNGSCVLNYDPGSDQLTLGGTWSPSPILVNTCAGAYYALPWTVTNGQTIETRADLVSVSPGATLAMVALHHSATECYEFEKGDGFVVIEKWHSPTHTCLHAERVAIPSTNVVLAIALTRVDPNVLVTGKLLDRQNGAVLYEKSVVDTPASDSSLTAADLAQITGLRQWPDYGPDPAGAPWVDGMNAGPALVVGQDTDVATHSTATFANFEVRTREVPQVSIARAVQLSWPAPAGVNYTLEGAPTVQGPFLPIQDLEIPRVQTLTVPLSGPAQFFRVVQAP